MITNEEHTMIHQYVIITIARKALEHDLVQINNSQLKLNQAYSCLLKYMLDSLSKELAIIKRFMQEHQLKIIPRGNDGMFSKYEYICRGYEGCSSYLNIHLKNQVVQYISDNLLSINSNTI